MAVRRSRAQTACSARAFCAYRRIRRAKKRGLRRFVPHLSLKQSDYMMFFSRKYQVPLAIRSSTADFRVDDAGATVTPGYPPPYAFKLLNLPLYALCRLRGELKKIRSPPVGTSAAIPGVHTVHTLGGNRGTSAAGEAGARERWIYTIATHRTLMVIASSDSDVFYPRCLSAIVRKFSRFFQYPGIFLRTIHYYNNRYSSK